MSAAHQRAWEAQLQRLARMRALSARKSLWQDLRDTVSAAKPYRLWQSTLSYLRRFRTVSFVLRLIGGIFTLLQTGTLVVLSTLIFFVLLPLLLLGLGGYLLYSLWDLRKWTRSIAEDLKGKQVYVFFSVGSFGKQFAHALAADPQNTVLIVSPFYLSPIGHGKGAFYFNLRREGERLYLIRRQFYLHVKRKHLLPTKTILIF